MRLARLEYLMDRRPLLLNRVLLRQNPHNVQEWLKRVKLYEEKPKEVSLKTIYYLQLWMDYFFKTELFLNIQSSWIRFDQFKVIVILKRNLFKNFLKKRISICFLAFFISLVVFLFQKSPFCCVFVLEPVMWATSIFMSSHWHRCYAAECTLSKNVSQVVRATLRLPSITTWQQADWEDRYIKPKLNKVR